MSGTSRTVNWPLIIMGAIASSFVGTLYGYSYLKGTIIQYWKHEAITDDEREELEWAVGIGYNTGFFGQYLAIFPGLIFDHFGGPITCCYGGLLCCAGFVSVGLAARYKMVYALWIGIFFAGQGSKGLGFGTLLGTVKAIPESMATGISGLYLMLDAMSSISAMYAYDWIFKRPDFRSWKDKAIGTRDFFFALGVTILIVGLTAGCVYYVFGPKEEGTAKDDELTDEEVEADGLRPSYRGSVVGSEQARRSSLQDEASLTAMRKLEHDTKRGDEEAPLLETEVPAEKATFWPGVVACFLIMLLGECQGLAFNNQIGDAFNSSRRAKVGLVTGKKYVEYKTLYHDFFDGGDLEHDEYENIRIFVQRQFQMIPSILEISEDRMTITLSPRSTHGQKDAWGDDDGPEDVKTNRVFTLKEKLSDGLVLVKKRQGVAKELTVQDFVKGAHNKERDLFKMLVQSNKEWSLATPLDDADCHHSKIGAGKTPEKCVLGLIINNLAPVAGFQIEGEKVHMISFTKNWSEKSKSNPFENQAQDFSSQGGGKFFDEYILGTFQSMLGKGKGAQLNAARSRMSDQEKKEIDGIEFFEPFPRILKSDSGSAQVLKQAVRHESHQKLVEAVRKESGGARSAANVSDAEAGQKLDYYNFYYPVPAREMPDLVNYPFRKWIVHMKKEFVNDEAQVRLTPQFLVEKRDGDPISPDDGDPISPDDGYPILTDVSKALFYDISRLAGHSKEMDAVKKYLTITFAVGNAFGRLGLGLISPPLERRSPYLQCSFWFVVGTILYAAVFGYLGIAGLPCTRYGEEKGEPIPGQPVMLYVFTGMIAILYGGMFTINTAYCKVIAPNMLGFVLGGSLVVLSVGCFVFGSEIPRLVPNSSPTDIDFSDHVGIHYRKRFFSTACAVQIVALFPAVFCWWAQIGPARTKIQQAEEERQRDEMEVADSE